MFTIVTILSGKSHYWWKCHRRWCRKSAINQSTNKTYTYMIRLKQKLWKSSRLSYQLHLYFINQAWFNRIHIRIWFLWLKCAIFGHFIISFLISREYVFIFILWPLFYTQHTYLCRFPDLLLAENRICEFMGQYLFYNNIKSWKSLILSNHFRVFVISKRASVSLRGQKLFNIQSMDVSII